MQTTRRSLVRLAAGLIAPMLGLACGGDEQLQLELTILHTNDTHARIAAIDRYGSTCGPQADPAECFGGVARRATLVREIRAERPNTLLLDAGDQFQGTLFYRRFRGLEAQRFMNHLAYDAMTLGNHEFDDGTEVLGRFAAGLAFPVVITNLDYEDDPHLAPHRVPSAVVTVAGERIGILGCLTEETVTVSRPGETVDFLPIEPELVEAVEELRADGIDKIVLLSHSGLERDLRIAASVAGLDVIVGGHTNVLLANDSPDSEGPYPIVVTGPEGDPVLIVQSFTWGKYLGRLDVVFDAGGVATAWSGDSILLDASVVEDEETLAMVAELAVELESFAAEVLGSTSVRLDGQERSCRAAECNLGDLIADALLEAHRGQGVEIALQNSGGIRSSLAAGPISLGRLLEVLPFPNTTSVFGLRGADLLAALEHGVSRAENLENDGTGRFLQVAGLRYSWSPTRPVGARILSAEVAAGDGWEPVTADRIYRVVSNDFTRNGGDGFEVLATRAIDPYDQGQVLADVVADHIRVHSPLATAVDGRIRRVP
ncbi:MAG: bifunctional metallophosphatase/5'-nucleotidase [Thermoanaerobaculia bacterium]|nr:bifunctional metallophosphatase/5'-nucleotidase [Thermoanaerobaculia bacterium]